MHPTLTPQLCFDHTVKRLETENKQLVDKLLSMKGKYAKETDVVLKDIKNKTKEINELKLNFQLK